MNLFGKLKNGLSKTRAGLVENIAQVVNATSRLDENFLEELEETLILGDIGTNSTQRLIDNLRQRSRKDKILSSNDLLKLLKEEMVSLLCVNDSAAQTSIIRSDAIKPSVISIVGVNGTGKTTTIGKLAFKLRQEGKSVLVAAADTFRAAAAEQLQIWTERAQADLVRNQPGADPASVAFDALSAAKARDVDVLIIDTAGRLHTKVNLMAELQKIHRVLDKGMPGAPHKIMLVLDATTGQNGLSQARQFTNAVGVTDVVLTKLDGTAKGGIVFSITNELGIPVKYVGLGEGINDLEEFDPQVFVEALFQ